MLRAPALLAAVVAAGVLATAIRWAVLVPDGHEADPARGLVSWVSPAAETLIGAGVGEYIAIAGERYEIIALDNPGAA